MEQNKAKQLKMQLKKCVHQTVTWLGKCVPQPIPIHVETVCLLSKLHEAKHHVNVRLDMDEMDLTAAERR